RIRDAEAVRVDARVLRWRRGRVHHARAPGSRTVKGRFSSMLGVEAMNQSKSIALAAAVAMAICALAAGANAQAAAALQPRGALQFFSDEAAFDAALGVPSNLTVETFDGGANVGPFPTLCGEPMGATSNDVCFTPGQLAPGFGITSTSGDGIIIFPNGFLGPNAPTRQVGA